MDDERTLSLETISSLSEAQPAKHGVFLLVYHRDGSQMVPLGEGQMVVIGRARPADLPIPDRSLSRQHARFSLVDNTIWVEDLASTNGTKVNGKRIKKSKVQTTDEVQLGAVTVAIHILLPNQALAQGLESHDRFVTKLEQELTRARTFGRMITLLMVRAAKRKEGNLSRWAPEVRRLLQPVDLIALYDPTAILIALVEMGENAGQNLARSILQSHDDQQFDLRFGVATFPDHGISAEELIEAVRTAVQRTSNKEPILLASSISYGRVDPAKLGPVVISKKMVELFNTAKRIAEAAIPVLIYGETGTGKEVLARTIHEHSKRRKKPLFCINCASIPEHLVESALFGHERGAFTGAEKQTKGLFEEADNGAVLLDEIGELSLSAQAKLLRVIETKKISRVGSAKDFEVDVRILAATHRDLEQMCESNAFRLDLYYRLNTMVLKIPPLRERREEILPLSESFIRAANKSNHCAIGEIESEAQQHLMDYHWPGNVRELHNVIERAVVIAQDKIITVDDLPERIRLPKQSKNTFTVAEAEQQENFSLKDRVKEFEAQLLLDALKANDWNQTHTAKALGMPLRTLVHKMRVLGIKKRYEND